MKIIEFLDKAGKYQIGDVAGFRDENADEYISSGKARLVRTLKDPKMVRKRATIIDEDKSGPD
jgi:hypothetical protein